MKTGLRTNRGNTDVLGTAFAGVFQLLLDTYKPAVRDLLTGNSLVLDDGLELSVRAGTAGAETVDLFIVRPGVDKKVLLQLKAHPGGGADDAPGSSIPPPEPWCTTIEGKIVWRLFNAIVINLEQPHNKPGE